MYDDPLRSAFTSVGPAPAVPDDVPTDADAIAAFFGGAEYVPPAPSDGDVGHASTLEAVAALYVSNRREHNMLHGADDYRYSSHFQIYHHQFSKSSSAIFYCLRFRMTSETMLIR